MRLRTGVRQEPISRIRRIGRLALATFWSARALLRSVSRPYESLHDLARAELLNTPSAERIASSAARLADVMVTRRHGDWSHAVRTSSARRETLTRLSNTEALRFLIHANVIVLKSATAPQERGVLLLKYSEVLNAFPLLFDIARVQQHFHIVLEPSTTAHLQPSTRLFSPETSIVAVQAPEPNARRAFSEMRFLPVNVSDGEWVDEDTFRVVEAPKRYDAAMIASFIPVKRHEFFFAALRDHWQGSLKIALLTSSHVGAGVDWGRAKLAEYNLLDAADVLVDVPQVHVNEVLNASRCHVLCSLREGANRACYEALFAGIPAIVHAAHVGFPHWQFPRTLVRTYEDAPTLVAAIRECRAGVNGREISEAAAKVTGARMALARLEAALRVEAMARGESWSVGLTPKVTRVHCCYRDAADFDRHRDAYTFLAEATDDAFSYDPGLARTLLTR